MLGLIVFLTVVWSLFTLWTTEHPELRLAMVKSRVWGLQSALHPLLVFTFQRQLTAQWDDSGTPVLSILIVLFSAITFNFGVGTKSRGVLLRLAPSIYLHHTGPLLVALTADFVSPSFVSIQGFLFAHTWFAHTLGAIHNLRGKAEAKPSAGEQVAQPRDKLGEALFFSYLLIGFWLIPWFCAECARQASPLLAAAPVATQYAGRWSYMYLAFRGYNPEVSSAERGGLAISLAAEVSAFTLGALFVLSENALRLWQG